MLSFGQLYYISGRDEEMYYKNTSQYAVLENVFDINHVPYSGHQIGQKYDDGYICTDIGIFHGFVYNTDDLDSYYTSCYIKDISRIIPIEKFDSKKKINLEPLIWLNRIPTQESDIDGLKEFQGDIQANLFVSKYNLHDGQVTVPAMDYQIDKFDYYCSCLTKAEQDFYVFRKQRLSETYNPYKQFNSGTCETYLLPFSTSSSYDFVKKWFSEGLILVIKVNKDSNYMVLHDQSQFEITLGPGTLEYVDKGFYNGQPIIICNYNN